MKYVNFTILLFLSVNVFSQKYNVLDFGAKSGGTIVNTKQIQAAIDKCTQNGGGQVIIPAGEFLSGTLILKDKVELYLSENAVLKGSPDFKDYPYLDVKFESLFKDKFYYNKEKTIQEYRAFIFAEATHGVSITGYGTIDGNGGSPSFQLGNDASSKSSMERPMLILMIDSRDVRIHNVHIRNSAYWMQNYLACENVHIHGIRVFNHCNYNNDGIDIDSKNVVIENCDIDADDDAICLKSHDPDRFCENIVIRNCTVRSNCNGIKMGTGSLGGFRNVRIDNITYGGASEYKVRSLAVKQKLTYIEPDIPLMLAGLAIENVDGGITDNITVSNLFMQNVQTPIFIKLGNRTPRRSKNPSSPAVAGLSNIKIDNVVARSHSKITSSITGYPGNDVQNIELNNIRISSMGTVTADEIPAVLPENEKNYPENGMFGHVLPSNGLYIRHAKGIVLNNITFEVRNPDARPDIIFDDVKQGIIYTCKEQFSF
jgi:polygalacturonase